MEKPLQRFEKIVRAAHSHTIARSEPSIPELHPFDQRNIHPEIARVAQKLFDDGHYSQATFEAFKYVDKQVSKISKIRKSGYQLMMSAFNEQNPKIKLTLLGNVSEVDEQKGFSFLFAGSAIAIRNPRGHEVGIVDPVDMSLDHLGLASFLLRRLSNRIDPKQA